MLPLRHGRRSVTALALKPPATPQQPQQPQQQQQPDQQRQQPQHRRALAAVTAAAAGVLGPLLPSWAFDADLLAPTDVGLDPGLGDSPQVLDTLLIVVVTYVTVMLLYLWLSSFMEAVRCVVRARGCVSGGGATWQALCRVSPATDRRARTCR
jgi:uncharacterized membrane protein YdbT with pleckstrin-like domain